jgi:ferredoxin
MMIESAHAAVQANKAYPAGLSRIFGDKPVPVDGVVFHSRGAVLISGPNAFAAADAARRLLARAADLHIVVFAPGIDSIADLPKAVRRVGGRIVSLKGHLGAFTASVPVGAGKEEDAGIFSPNEDRMFDLVLDLFPSPLLKALVPPLGYFAVGDSTTAVVRALETLPTLAGTFHKPKFFNHASALCQHQINGVVGCTRCLSVCAAQAIHSVAGGLEIDPYLCQGCATCVLVCPSGAMTFALPAVAELEARMARPDGHADARKDILLVHDAACREAARAVDSVRIKLLEVNPLAAFSETQWLQALTQGFAAVRLVLSPDLPARSRELLQATVAEMRAILGAIGRDPETLAALDPQDLAPSIRRIAQTAATTPVAAAVSVRTDGKRARLLAVIDQLARRNLRKDVLALPPASSFGKVTVDARSCTLCLSCVSICPTQALGGQLAPLPLLAFKESLCVQCGVCRAVCPEQAISLQARFVPDPLRRDEMRIINRDEQVSCTRCNTPFIGRHFLERSIKMMQDRLGAPPGASEFLRLCPSCRQRGTSLS